MNAAEGRGPLTVVLGIRPDVIRASLILRKLSELLDPREFEFVWSGQHYSDNLKDVFFRQLDVPPPSFELGARGTSDTALVSDIIRRLGEYFEDRRPTAAVFLGDTNTVVGAVAAAANNVPVVHVEGCMRSYDWRMPEEKYRTLVDHLSDVIYAYVPAYARQGYAEGIPDERIFVTGNLIVDVLEYYFISGRIRLSQEARQGLLRAMGVNPGKFLLMTCHRRENVDDRASLERIMNLAQASEKPIVFPAGYRTQMQLAKFGMTLPRTVRMVDPIGYVDFLELLSASGGVLTDSGTVVEEASILMKPSIQMRRSTERPEVYEVGGSIRFDPTEDGGPSTAEDALARFTRLGSATWRHSLGDGQASDRIVNDLMSRLRGDRFSTHAPDLTDPLVGRAYMSG